jgi:hypothetical protein
MRGTMTRLRLLLAVAIASLGIGAEILDGKVK